VRIGVVDDEVTSRTVAVRLVQRFGHEFGVRTDVQVFGDGAELVAGYQPVFDVLLMDVRMGGMDGIRAAQAVRRLDSAVEIVFITNLPQLAAEGYRVQAVDFLVKPLSYERLRATLARVMSRMREREAPHVLLDTHGGRVRLGADEIVSFTSARRYTEIRCLGQLHRVPVPLKAFEERLGDHGFHRVSIGTLVNLRHVVAVQEGRCVMVDHSALVVSRARKKAFVAALTDYLGAGGARGRAAPACAAGGDATGAGS
jgi:DNA-binding LytR/AlgR family response regulator